MALTAETIDRLKAQLLTSGLSQQNQPLFQVINLLIDAVRQSLSGVVALTSSGGAAGPQGPIGESGPTPMFDFEGIDEIPYPLPTIHALTQNLFSGENSFANFPINLLSGGIKFPATQIAYSDANTLDDYEEGTWTPTLTYDTPGDLAVAYSIRQGSYTKIGNVVRVDFFYVTSSYTFTTAVGNLRITGLPFTSGATYYNFGVSQPNQVWPTYTDFFCRVDPSESRITFLGYSNATGPAFLTAADTTSGVQQSGLGTVFYKV
jgi:hypothetical protein